MDNPTMLCTSGVDVIQRSYGFALGAPPYRIAGADGLLRAVAAVFARSITAALAPGFSIVGGGDVGLAGVDVGAAGDVNADGLDDLIVSAFAPPRSGPSETAARARRCAFGF